MTSESFVSFHNQESDAVPQPLQRQPDMTRQKENRPGKNHMVHGHIIDFHTHAFPDGLAPSAMEKLTGSSGIKAFTNGSLLGLTESMDRAGVDISVVHSIATAPKQAESIRRWALSIRSPRIIPFPSVHPESKSLSEDLLKIAENNFLGIKLHPEYQNFYIDDDKMHTIYQICSDRGLIIFFHGGEDISFPSSDRGSPRRISIVKKSYETLTIVAGHMGGWRCWEEVVKYLIGNDVYLETGYTRGYLSDDFFREMLLSHRPDRLVFGSDSPWDDQSASATHLMELGLPEDLMEDLFFRNGHYLLKMHNQTVNK